MQAIDSLTETEQEALEMFRGLSSEERKLLLQLLEELKQAVTEQSKLKATA